MAIQGLITSGRLAVFAAGADGTLGYMQQTPRHAVWTEWTQLGPELSGVPSVFQNPDGRVELFALGPDGQLGHVWETEFDAGWSDWETLGPALGSDPVLVHNADGRLEVFGRGPDGALGHTWQVPEAGWALWDDLGPEISGRPTVFQNAGGHLEVFAVGANGVLGHMWQLSPSGHAGWSPWEEIGPEGSGDPALFINKEGHLEVFALGPDGRLGHRWQTAPDYGWSDWEVIGPAISGKPVPFQNADGRIEVFGRGPDGALGHMWQEPAPLFGWSEWADMGPTIEGDPAVFQNADGRIEVFGRGPDGALGHMWQPEPSAPEGWSGWEGLGVSISGPPAAGQIGKVGGGEITPEVSAVEPAGPTTDLTADVCVIGAGPAGITVAAGLVAAGAKVVLLESGDLHEDPQAQELNEGLADGPVIKRRWTYLREGRRRMIQGSAAIWGVGWLMPFQPLDFESRPWVERSGWPVTAEEMAPYMARASETFGFEAFDPPPRQDGSLVRLSYRFPEDPLLFRNRYLDLLRDPLFDPQTGTTAVDVVAKGDRVESVRAIKADGSEVRVQADNFVLAAGGVENARFLLLHEKVLGASAMTGRCFMEHPHILAGSVRLPEWEPLRSYLEWGKPQLDVLGLDEDTQAEHGLLNVMVQVRKRGALDPGPVDCEMYVRAEQAPNPNSQVILGEKDDRLGQRQPVLHWRTRELDWDSILRTVELVGTGLKEHYGAEPEPVLKPNEPWPHDPVGPAEGSYSAWGNHHMGTTRMSQDLREGVVDPDCRLHGTANFYVAGSSVFPTGSCANPTFTIVAMAHRLVDHLSGTNGSA